MRTLTLVDKKSTPSSLQTIWEVWFTLSILSAIIAIGIYLLDNTLLGIGIINIVFISINVVMSIIIGITTSED